MNREYLEDLEQRDEEEYEKLVLKRLEEGKFDFSADRYPPDDRFHNLQKPIALAGEIDTGSLSNIWAQIPFCGSLILPISAWPQKDFEEFFFSVSEIPEILDFIKETGKLQIVRSAPAMRYEGLNYLDPIFKELDPPSYKFLPPSELGTENEIKKAYTSFDTLLGVRNNLWRTIKNRDIILSNAAMTYVFLKLRNYSIVDEIENLLIDDPRKAILMFLHFKDLVAMPACDLRQCQRNFSLKYLREAHQQLPMVYHPSKIKFPCEIGRFLLRNLTHAAQDRRACYYLMDNFADYDLQKVLNSLNEAVLTEHPDVIEADSKATSEILENIWNDQTLQKKSKTLFTAMHLSIAALGPSIGYLIGGIAGLGGGFLAALGFNVGGEYLKIRSEKLAEGISKFYSRNYQANIYDFQKKYEGKIRKKEKYPR